jgi:anti-anti-sigma factor
VLPSPSLAATFGRISVESEADASVLRLVGEIDDVAIAAFEEAATAPGSGRAPGTMISIVDLAQVTYFSSAGVSFLLRSTREARNMGRRPLLRGLDNPARRVLHLTGVTELFDAEV